MTERKARAKARAKAEAKAEADPYGMTTKKAKAKADPTAMAKGDNPVGCEAQWGGARVGWMRQRVAGVCSVGSETFA